MRILIDFLNSAKNAGLSEDHRYSILSKVGLELKRRGHTVVGQAVTKNTEIPDFSETFEQSSVDTIDLYIVHSPYNNARRMELATALSARRCFNLLDSKSRVLFYDHGWLYNSIVLDRRGLFGNSYYVGDLDKRSRRKFNLEEAVAYSNYLRTNNLTKRSQPAETQCPNDDYIFIPGQVLHDASIVHFSRVGLLELIDRTVEFARTHGLTVVFKPHPGSNRSEMHGKQNIKEHCEKLCNEYEKFYVNDGAIFPLMESALFTATVNGGSIVDNCITQTPVLTCGRSMFMNSRSVVFDPNISRGLESMLATKADKSQRELCQLRVLYWLRNKLMQEEFPVERNISIMEWHSGLKF